MCILSARGLWCGRCYANVRGRAAYPGHRGFRAPVSIYKVSTTMALRKPSPSPGGGGSVYRAASPGMFTRWQGVWEYLSEAYYEGGDPRELATLMFFIHDGRLTAALNDRDQQRTMFCSGDTPESILDALEGHIQGGTGEWRPSGFKAKPRKK